MLEEKNITIDIFFHVGCEKMKKMWEKNQKGVRKTLYLQKFTLKYGSYSSQIKFNIQYIIILAN